MSTMNKKVKSFVKQFAAFVTGDTAAALGEKVYRVADSELTAQIASLNALTVRLETKVEKAEEGIAKARINHGKMIEDGDMYIKTLLEAKKNHQEVSLEMTKHKSKIEFLQSELKALNEEVDSE